MLCVLLVVLAYWHGELGHDDASRYMAIARLLLEVPRLRWGSKLRDAIRVVTEVSQLAEFCLHNHMQTLLPSSNPNFPLLVEQTLDDSQTTVNVDAARVGMQSTGLCSRDDIPYPSPTQMVFSMPELTSMSSEYGWDTSADSLGLWQISGVGNPDTFPAW
jgi:hypothetical protein